MPINHSAAGSMRNVADRVMSPYDAEIVTCVVDPTGVVVIGKLAVNPPSGIVTDDGIVAALPASDSATTAPPAGAGLTSVTVPVAGLPPPTDVADSVIDIDCGGMKYTFALCD